MKTICMIAQSNYVSDPRIMRQAYALEKDGYQIDIIGLGWDDDPKIVKNGSISSIKVMNHFARNLFIPIFFILRFSFLEHTLNFYIYPLIRSIL